MKKADWILDYDMHTDKCYRRPGCQKCQAPVGVDHEGDYVCFCCGKAYELDDEMRQWMDDQMTEKVEMHNCINCGGEGTMETHCYKNHVSGEWMVAYGRCSKCGMRLIV